jgi:hypothetical protein
MIWFKPDIFCDFVMGMFLFENFCRYICDGRLEMDRERNEIVL